MKILILGSSGQLGKCLKDQFQNSSHKLIFSCREDIDISNFELTKILITKIAPDLIINASAYTAVDKAEENEEYANVINNLAVKNIAKICNDIKCFLIHISTDYVFDGHSNKPYKEDDKINPQSVYGFTKLAGELAIQYSGCKHIIIRTAWVFSEYGNNFLKNMLNLAEKFSELNVVDDQIGCPTYAQDLAKLVVNIVPVIDLQKNNAIYHYSGNTSCSWYEFANEIFNYAKTKNLKIPKKINALKTCDYNTLAKRPMFSVLDSSKVESEFNVSASDWKKGIIKSINRI